MARPKAAAVPRAAIEVRHALSEAQARELRTLADDHAAAQVALSWAGGGDPIDRHTIEAEALLAEARLSAFIARLVREGK